MSRTSLTGGSADGDGEARGTSTTRRLTLGLAVLLVLAGAAWLDVAAGRRGFFAFDQSILFDAGFRIHSGQTPFADFRLPFGPVAPALQAALFRVFGVDFAGYLASAALANAVAAGLAMALLARLLPGRPGWWLLGGALTAIWFYPPSGTPWFEQTALLFVLAGIVLLLPAVLAERPRAVALLAAAGSGACAVLALLTKQNAGAAALPAFVLVLSVPWIQIWLNDLVGFELDNDPAGRRRDHRPWAPAAAWLAGSVAAAGAFALWLLLFADPALFVRFAVEVPAAEGARRFVSGPGRLLTGSSIGYGPLGVRLAITLTTVCAVAGVAFALRRRRRRDGRSELPAAVGRRLLASGSTAIGLYLTQHLLTASSFNQPAVSLGLTGLLLPLGTGTLLAALSSRPTPRLLRTTVLVITAGAALLLAGRGLQIAFTRSGQDAFPPGARFDRPVEAAGLHGLLWGRPTYVEPAQPQSTGPGRLPRARAADGARARVTAGEFERLLALLRSRDGGLLVFPDWTVLYGLAGRPAPGPLVWFHRGLTYTATDASEIDRLLVRSLDRHEVRTVVLERSSWQGTDRRLADFPRLRERLAACYRPVETIGIFEVRARRASCPRARASYGAPTLRWP